MTAPLVTVGIPTFNRAQLLRRAIGSVLEQDHAPIELIIADNASTDDTQRVCEEYVARHPSVRYVRHASNLGAEENFRCLPLLARGRYFMWLGDDDWLDPQYVRRCLEALLANPKLVLVGGLAAYYEPGSATPYQVDVPITLLDPSPRTRFLSYLELVFYNGLCYGLMHTDAIRRVGVIEHFGGDWTMVAAMCLLGKVRTLPDVRVHRLVGGGSSRASLNKAAGLPPQVNAEWAYPIFVARGVVSAIRRGESVFSMLSRGARARLAREAGTRILATRYRRFLRDMRVAIAALYGFLVLWCDEALLRKLIIVMSRIKPYLPRRRAE